MSERELSKNMSNLFKASWAVAAVAVLLVGFILRPDAFSFGYWLRIGWSEVLVGLFFVSTNWLFGRNTNSAEVAISPSLGVIMVIYCLISFGLMMFFWMFEENNSASSIHLVMQVVALAVFLLLVFQVQLSSQHARAGLEVSASGCKLPSYYINKISVIEQSLSPEVQKELKKLREKMKYSLINAEKIKHITEYENYTSELDRVLAKPDKISPDDVKKLYLNVEEIITLMKGN